MSRIAGFQTHGSGGGIVDNLKGKIPFKLVCFMELIAAGDKLHSGALSLIQLLTLNVWW